MVRGIASLYDTCAALACALLSSRTHSGRGTISSTVSTDVTLLSTMSPPAEGSDEAARATIASFRRRKPSEPTIAREPAPLWKRLSQATNHAEDDAKWLCRRYSFDPDETWATATALSDVEKTARQGRLLAFIDSCEPRVEELLNEAVQAGADLADCIALLSDGTVLPRYTKLVPRSEVAAEVALLLRQVDEPLLHEEWNRPTPGHLLTIVLFEGVQAVSEFCFSVCPNLGPQA